MWIASLFFLARRQVSSMSASVSPKHPERGTCFPGKGAVFPIFFGWRTPCSQM